VLTKVSDGFNGEDRGEWREAEDYVVP